MSIILWAMYLTKEIYINLMGCNLDPFSSANIKNLRIGSNLPNKRSKIELRNADIK